MKLGVITVSTRDGRVGAAVADWFAQFAKAESEFEIVPIDLKDVNLPVLDEPNHPLMHDYQFEHTKRWSELVTPLDAFVFVTPEYDYFVPGALVNAIDYLATEWSYKPAGFVGYGGISGGLRSIQAAKPLLTSVKMMPLPESVSIHFVQNNLENNVFTPERKHEDMARIMLTELTKWATA
ncbi:MAG TPA: NADPH-dependent FMN reductase, partial [Candidatus Saccharimonadales bacterium]|nr:NADPH-dependent FMN reductase [Candidatus Saccharimonadales bacterium]